VLSISPTNGCAAGGTSITISGTNFLNGATVSIGGLAATSVVFVNSNTLTAVTPANSAGARNVAVTNPDTSSATLTNGFTYSGSPTFAGLDSVTPAIEGATLTWSAASGMPPLSYDVWEGTQSFGEDLLFTTNSLSVFVPLYPGSNSPITYFFVVQAVDGCGNNDDNLNELTVQPLLDPNKSQVSDGIPNGWKQQYGLNPFDPSVAAADLDGDGLSNLQEFLISTDPTDKNSPFHIIAIVQEDDDLRITWADATGRTNVVEAASDVGGIYSNISPNIIVPGSGVGATNYLDAGALTNSLLRFYRVRLVP
jgi:IPT/TIG domain